MKTLSILFSNCRFGVLLGIAGTLLGLAATSASAVPVTTGLTAWFDASDPTGTGVVPSVNGAPLSTWVNKAPLAQQDGISSVVQNDPLLQPTITTGALNGLPVVQYNPTIVADGAAPGGFASDYMQAANNFTTPLSQPDEMFIVWYSASAGPGNNAAFAVDGGADGTGRQTVAYAANGNLSVNVGAPTASTSQFAFGTAAVETTVAFNGDPAGSGSLWVNGTAFPLGTDIGTGDLDGLTLGARFGSIPTAESQYGNFTLDGYIAEVLIYNQILSTPDQLAVESYLQQKWFGAPVPEPASCVLFGLGALGVAVATVGLAQAVRHGRLERPLTMNVTEDLGFSAWRGCLF